MQSGEGSPEESFRALAYEENLRVLARVLLDEPYERYDCFSCGRPMTMMSQVSGWCSACEVQEQRESRQKPLPPRWFTDPDGTVSAYVDHASGYHPHP